VSPHTALAHGLKVDVDAPPKSLRKQLQRGQVNLDDPATTLAFLAHDANVGAIVALAPDLSAFTTLLGVDDATVRTVLNSWGPGKFDAELALDGKAFRPDGQSATVLIPPAFGLAGVNLHTWTGWGSVTHWNAYVANLEMHGKGRFF
jgi:hypothetical protein